MPEAEKHASMANAIRALAMDAVEAAKSGHPGLPMGAADIATVLFTRHLKFDPTDPNWPDRDRFVLSAGHGSMLLYSLLYLLGYDEMTIEELKNFRQLGSKTAGHPEVGEAPGIETTTGPLGQGIANAVGMALAERMLNARFGDGVVDHYTYVLCSDGDLMEGISQEAIALAGHLKLSRLIVIFDDNHITIDGDISLSDSTDQVARVEASGWNAVRIDGHDPEQIDRALTDARQSDRPTLIAARTTIGFGAPNKAGKSSAHGSPLGEKEVQEARERLDWPYEPFHIPADILDAWRIAGLRARPRRKAWQERFEGLDAELRGEFARTMAGDLPPRLDRAIAELKREYSAEPPTLASRKASQAVLECIAPVVPEMIGGSGDLTGSNNTRTSEMKAVAPGEYSGRFIHWGIREHGMAAAMNGMALHKGLIPFSGTFLTFSDYCRPAIRLAALMRQRVIFVMTHDSIGLGEDGPTHQPVEHLAALRAIPNLSVWRPADAVETAECWQLALATSTGPSVIVLTRQDLTPLRGEYEEDNLCRRGAYVIADCSGDAEVSLFATGSEVAIAVAAKDLLDERGHPARVVSIPSFDVFAQQSDVYRQEIIGTAPLRIGVEAAIRQGWDAIIGEHGLFVGMTGFGASGPYEELYRHFGITAEAICEKAIARLEPKDTD
ncbi:transketolase [Afifella aestuarii]|uniref:transketolase n=1 Tax=Afifella aestuarii TaxID=1909496 RepID=UPI000FE2CF89|nr:transketolase [Afifella aestuarii]